MRVIQSFFARSVVIQVSALARDLTDTNSSTDEHIEQLQSELRSTSDLLEEARGKLLDFEQQAEGAQATMSQLTEVWASDVAPLPTVVARMCCAVWLHLIGL